MLEIKRVNQQTKLLVEKDRLSVSTNCFPFGILEKFTELKQELC